EDLSEARPRADLRGVAAWKRGPLVAQRAGSERVQEGSVARRFEGMGRRFRRGTMDGAGSHRPRRARARDHAVAADTLPLETTRFVRREGDRRAPQRVWRPRGEEVMSEPTRVSARTSVQVPGVQARDRADPCTMVIFGALGDLSRRKL